MWLEMALRDGGELYDVSGRLTEVSFPVANSPKGREPDEVAAYQHMGFEVA